MFVTTPIMRRDIGSAPIADAPRHVTNELPHQTRFPQNMSFVANHLNHPNSMRLRCVVADGIAVKVGRVNVAKKSDDRASSYVLNLQAHSCPITHNNSRKHHLLRKYLQSHVTSRIEATTLVGSRQSAERAAGSVKMPLTTSTHAQRG